MLNIKPSTYVFQKNIVTTGQEKWFLAMCAAKAAKRIWRRQCGQDAIEGPGAPLLATYPGEAQLCNQNQTFGASFCVKLRQVDPILLL